MFGIFHDTYDNLDGAGHGMLNDLLAVLDAQEYKPNGKPDLCDALMEICGIQTRAEYYELAKAAA